MQYLYCGAIYALSYRRYHPCSTIHVVASMRYHPRGTIHAVPYMQYHTCGTIHAVQACSTIRAVTYVQSKHAVPHMQYHTCRTIYAAAAVGCNANSAATSPFWLLSTPAKSSILVVTTSKPSEILSWFRSVRPLESRSCRCSDDCSAVHNIREIN